MTGKLVCLLFEKLKLDYLYYILAFVSINTILYLYTCSIVSIFVVLLQLYNAANCYLLSKLNTEVIFENKLQSNSFDNSNEMDLSK